MRNPGDQRLHYNIIKWINQGSLEILHNISENVTLVQFMDTIDNVNHVVSRFGYWIFELNYKFHFR